MASAPPAAARGSLPDPPDPKTVVEQTVLVSPDGSQYQVLRTNQRDATDEPENGQPPGCVLDGKSQSC